MQTEGRATRRSMTTGQRVRWILGLSFALLFLLLMVRWYMGTLAPLVVIPTPVLPNPNAYNTFVSAADQLQDEHKIGYAFSTASSHTTGDKDDRDYTQAEKDALIAENAETLKLLREGLTQPFVYLPNRSPEAQIAYGAQCRSLTRLLELDAQTRAGHGDWGGAMNSHLDAFQMGEENLRGAPLMHVLVGYASQTIGRRGAMQHIERLDAKQAKASAHRLEQILAREATYADILQQQKWETQAELLETFRHPDRGANPQGGAPIPASIESGLFFLFYSKRAIMHNYTSGMDQIIANAKQPYAAHPEPPKTPSDPFSPIMLSIFDHTQFTYVKYQALNRLFLVMLALRAYHVEHNAYPQSLSELAPAYLKQLPDDPFALKGTFQYRKEGNNYLLYSLGPDGKDDGGKIIDDVRKTKSKTSGNRYYVEETSIGDIVAGKNIW